MNSRLAQLCSLAHVAAVLVSCQTIADTGSSLRVQRAERFFRGVYGGDPSVVDELASPDVVVSYPIFEKVLGKPAIRGRDPLQAFVRSFAAKWADPEIGIDVVVESGDHVVLVWSFRARSAELAAEGGSVEDARYRDWGGISVFRFDVEDRVIEEFGEESVPGPTERLRASRTAGR